MRSCTKCGETKPLDDFYNQKGGKFGKRSICKPCCNSRSVEWARNNKQAADAATKRWRDKNPDKQREYARGYYWRNPELLRAKAKQYRAENWDTAYAAIKRWKLANPDRVKELNAESRDRRRESIRAWNAAYKKANPERGRAHTAKRRARLLNAPGADYTTAEHIEQRWALYGNCCVYCGAEATTTDHRIPLSRGGSHWPANLFPCCGWCNPSKGARTEREYRAAA
jgi:5-methylcytosine-specific restriction endonuclease McrA